MEAASTTLPDLPTELVDWILSYAAHLDNATCAIICRVDRRGNKLASPMLYRFIGISTPKGGVHDRAERLQALCRTLIERPDLLSQVEEVDQYLDSETPVAVRRNMSHAAWIDQCTSLLNMLPRTRDRLDDYLPFETALHLHGGFAPLQKGEYVSHIHNSDEICLLFILILCTNLTTLRLAVDIPVIRKMGHLFAALGGFSHFSPPRVRCGLDAIQELFLRPTNLIQSVAVENVWRFLCLPSLTTLHIDSLGSLGHKLSDDDPEFLQGRYVDSSALRNLVISNCTANYQQFASIIVACSSLVTIKIEWAADKVGFRRSDWGEMGAMLRDCKMLEKVQLECVPCIPRAKHKGFGLSIGTFQCLEHLEELHLPMTALIKPGDDHDVLKPMEFGVEDWEEHPVIFIIHIPDATKTYTTRFPDSLKRLVAMCEHDTFEQSDRRFLEIPALEKIENIVLQSCKREELLSMRFGVIVE